MSAKIYSDSQLIVEGEYSEDELLKILGKITKIRLEAPDGKFAVWYNPNTNKPKKEE